MRPLVMLLLGYLFMVIWAPAAGAQRDAASSPRRPAKGQICEAPSDTVSLSQLRVSSVSRLQEAADRHAGTSGTSLLAVFDSQGSIQSLYVLGGPQPLDAPDHLKAELSHAIVIHPVEPGPRAAQLRWHTDSRRLEVMRSPWCWPKPIHSRRVAQPDRVLHQRVRSGTSATALLRVSVGTDGQVSNTEVLRSSGDPTVDEALVKIPRETRFHPALMQGIPVGFVFITPVAFDSL